MDRTLRNGRLHDVHNVLGEERHRVPLPPLPMGAHRLGRSFTPTGQIASTVNLLVDGEAVASGPISRETLYPYVRFGEFLCIGPSDPAPVEDTYAAPFRFTGTLDRGMVSVSGGPYEDLALQLAAFFATL